MESTCSDIESESDEEETSFYENEVDFNDSGMYILGDR